MRSTQDLLLANLDNTLIDRAGAFARWAAEFVSEMRADPADVEWLIQADGDGFVPREALAASIAVRFGMGASARDNLLATVRGGLVEHIVFDNRVSEALTRARATGWVVVVVTDGTVAQQERKLRDTGLEQHVDGWIISEAAGVKKPDPQIFALAAAAAGLPLAGWMVGDSAKADIAGAHEIGLSTVWLRRGRDWQLPGFRPTAVAGSCTEAIQAIVGQTVSR